MEIELRGELGHVDKCGARGLRIERDGDVLVQDPPFPVGFSEAQGHAHPIAGGGFFTFGINEPLQAMSKGQDAIDADVEIMNLGNEGLWDKPQTVFPRLPVGFRAIVAVRRHNVEEDDTRAIQGHQAVEIASADRRAPFVNETLDLRFRSVHFLRRELPVTRVVHLPSSPCMEEVKTR